MMYSVPIIILTLGLILLFFIPKRLSIKEVYNTWTAIALLTVLTDLIVGAVFDKFDFAGSKKIQLSDLFFEITITPVYGIILLCLMPESKVRFLITSLLWTVIGISIEWLNVMVGYLDYKGWSLWYSIPFYFATCYFLRWHLWFLRRG
ncbi:hypothetical protein [Alkalihalobacillus sp. AL-G]|uniref:hypothetical protein n=1 Tax=Alkalihalobacillus sp. AL-G TaxID=2926399 RepID=UPI00272CB764|nr:hypothetical protein [Alkalihalobacillus sp. AL-G]WLD94060.1 hypothetical protein MOJ78_03940 [Alkalihalobacillus sp. AL-G]